MTNIVNEFFERAAERHAQEMVLGIHDGDCEWERDFLLCNCQMRTRIRESFTELPTDDLYFPPPECPKCNTELYWDDGWQCDDCHVRWDSNGDAGTARFTDDNGDLSRCEEHGKRACHLH